MKINSKLNFPLVFKTLTVLTLVMIGWMFRTFSGKSVLNLYQNIVDQPNDAYQRFATGGIFASGGVDYLAKTDELLFSSPLTGRGDICCFNLTTKKLRSVVRSNVCEVEPVYSQDGNRIFFVRQEKNASHLWKCDLDGRNETQLTSGPVYDSYPLRNPANGSIEFTRVNDESREGKPYKILSDDALSKSEAPATMWSAYTKKGAYVTRSAGAEVGIGSEDQIFFEDKATSADIRLAGNVASYVEKTESLLFYRTYNQEIWIKPRNSLCRLLYRSPTYKESPVAYSEKHARYYFLEADPKDQLGIGSVDADGKRYEQIVSFSQ